MTLVGRQRTIWHSFIPGSCVANQFRAFFNMQGIGRFEVNLIVAGSQQPTAMAGKSCARHGRQMTPFSRDGWRKDTWSGHEVVGGCHLRDTAHDRGADLPSQ